MQGLGELRVGQVLGAGPALVGQAAEGARGEHGLAGSAGLLAPVLQEGVSLRLQWLQ